ncbi:proton extrusion protein PcxA [Scytonema sp. PCC 10023]|uniref:proton extrusion protein PcxA n=1 Tax=Scytonema sp. PCC 10023 TaxID=1680591 RepID=UPI0039C6FD34
MISSVFRQKIYPFLVRAYQWYLRTSERSLDQAYTEALQIKAIEDEHFNGNKIDFDSTRYSRSVMDYFESDVKKHLKIIRMRLTEFKASRLFLNDKNEKAAREFGIEYPHLSLILEKLKFIDEVTGKYKFDEIHTNDSKVANNSLTIVEPSRNQLKQPNLSVPKLNSQSVTSKTNTTGVLPRSIFNTFTRLQIELDPKAEQDVVKNFRTTQRRTIISVRFILLLIIVPILTHQLSKALVVGPIVDRFFDRNSEKTTVFLNYEMEEEALQELERFEERIKFNNLLGTSELLSPEQLESEVKTKAREIAEEFRGASSNAIKNVFADILSVVTFTWLLLTSKREIAVLKDFFDHVVYGLSDSAKAFIIILFTDIFVGFHSPHGWEVILDGISRHWGLPANHDFIFLFIATFPVILDTIFKYWIFRYLNRISPSAVATYHNMNE